MPDASAIADTPVDDRARTLRLPVAGMTCGGCAARLGRALEAAPGVAGADVNLATETAEVRLAPGGPGLTGIAALVADTGYRVREVPVEIDVRGMSCSACAGRVQRALEAAPGVIAAEVNPATDHARVRAVQGADPAPMLAAIREAGYTPALRDAAGAAQARAAEDAATDRAERRELVLAAALTLPLVAPMLAMPVAPFHWPPAVELLLAAPVQIWVGRRFHRGAWAAVKGGGANMDVLVSLGTSAAFLWSCWLMLSLGADAAGRLYFEAAAVVITLVLTGKALETRAKRAAGAELRRLMELRPETARILRAGAEVDVPAGEVAAGDLVVVRPGERLPVDGEIVKGETELDESLVTGEPMPVLRRVGEEVPAGAVNGPGLIRLRATRVGADGTLNRIAALVAAAQTGKAPVQRLVDRISAVFVPAVIALAALTFAGWLIAGGGVEAALISAVSVLVVACPCALGLATPAALVAGTGAAARAGVLIRDLAALERAARIDTVVFDKTGTLTEGRPVVAEAHAADGDLDALLRLAAAAEHGSEHPLGRALREAASDRGLALPACEDFRAAVGGGVSASVEGRAIRVGLVQWAAPAGDPALDAEAARLEADGATVVWVGEERRALGILALRDPLRPGAAEAVAALRAKGLAVRLLTGDAEGPARRAAAAVGIEEVEARVRPEGKAAAMTRLAAEGRRAAMVGDGVNDAPALAAAEVGIAMGGGADAALETAGVALMRPDPRLVAAAVEIAAATSAKIRQNLGWAFAYNVLCLPAAALGWLSPGLAGAAMALSSVSVVGNALLLSRWRARP